MAKKKAAMSSDIAKALARLSSGLYVVTADSKGAKGAMVGLQGAAVRIRNGPCLCSIADKVSTGKQYTRSFAGEQA